MRKLIKLEVKKLPLKSRALCMLKFQNGHLHLVVWLAYQHVYFPVSYKKGNEANSGDYENNYDWEEENKTIKCLPRNTENESFKKKSIYLRI